VLAQPLALVKCKKRHVASWLLDDLAADDRAVLVVDEFTDIIVPKQQKQHKNQPVPQRVLIVVDPEG
jgi:hypothetical protein